MKISANALAAFLLLLCSGAMATRSKYITVGSAVAQADHYPQCGLPAPYQTTNLRRVFNPDGSLMSCVDLSSLPPSNNVQAFDLFALQLVVNPQCSKAVTSITFNGKAMTPVITAFAREQNVGVKIAGPSEYAPLVQYSALRMQRAQVCITLKTPCANADSLYNIITYFTQQFPVDATRCATTPLFNPAPAPAQTTTTSSPAPCGSSPSPAPCSSPSPAPCTTASPSPAPCTTASPSPAPCSSPSPAPCSTASPSPVPCTTASPSPAPCNSPKPAPCSSPSMPTVPSGTAYPICTLPSPYLTSGRKLTFDAAGDLTTCVQLSALPPANNRQAFDLQALQMVVSLQGKCAGAVKSVTFDGQAMTPTITQYTREQNVGIKISGNNGSPLATYASLRVRPVTVCLTMKFPCASADSVYNTVTFFAPDNCATTPLFDPNQQAW